MITKDLNKIISEIVNNEVVSIPTDTVYGLSCNISKKAVIKITKLKERDLNKGFIIISHNYNHLLKYVDTNKLSNEQINEICSKQIQPTTWVVPIKNNSNWLTGGKITIAIRLVTTDIITHICSTINSAIISTSANLSNKHFINDVKSINKVFNNIYIFETKVKSLKPSKIINIISRQQYR